MGQKHHERNGHLFIAFGLIFVGCLLLLEQMDLVTSFDFWDLWPLLLVLIGLNLISNSRRNRRQPFIGSVFVILGSYLLLEHFDLMPNFYLDWELVWPVLLIILGLKLFLDSQAEKEKQDNRFEKR